MSIELSYKTPVTLRPLGTSLKGGFGIACLERYPLEGIIGVNC